MRDNARSRPASFPFRPCLLASSSTYRILSFSSGLIRFGNGSPTCKRRQRRTISGPLPPASFFEKREGENGP